MLNTKIRKDKNLHPNISKINSWYIFLALIPILIFSPYTIEPVLHIRYISFGIFEIIGIFILFRNLKNRLCLPQYGLFFFIGWGLYLSASLIGLFVFGDKSGDGTFLWLQILLVGTLPLILSQIFLSNNFFSDNVLKLFVLSGAIALIFGFNQLFGVVIYKNINHATLYEITSVFAHKNIFSEILILILPCSAIALITFKGFWKYLGLIVAVSCLFMIIVLMSKAAWVALVIGLISTILVFLVFYLIRPVKILHSFTKKHILNLFVFLIIAVISLVLISRLEINKPLKSQIHDLTRSHVYANKDRLELWKKTIDLCKNHLITGVGLGSWKIEIMKEGNKNLVSEDNLTFFQRPHNDYLWIFSEQGLPALIIYLLVISIILTMCYILALRSTNVKNRIFYLLLNSAIIMYLVYSCFSFPRERIEHSIILGFLFAIIIIDYNRIFQKEPQGFSKLFLFPLAVLVCISIFIGISRYVSELRLKHAYQARLIENWSMESEEINKSYSIFFKMDFVSTPLKWYKGEACFNLNNIDEALSNFKEAEKVNPYHIHVLNNIGTCYELKGNHLLAIQYYKAAINYSFYFEDALFNLCAVYYNIKNYEKAVATLQMINPETKDKRYSKFAFATIDKYLKQLIGKTDDKIILKYLTKIEYDPDWSYQIFVKSFATKKDFKDQLMLDIIWSIEMIDKDFTLSKKVKNKKLI